MKALWRHSASVSVGGCGSCQYTYNQTFCELYSSSRGLGLINHAESERRFDNGLLVESYRCEGVQVQQPRFGVSIQQPWSSLNWNKAEKLQL